MADFAILFLNFILYSFVGYCCEVIFCSISAKRFVNRGFLFGPVCPIYGIGAIFIIYFLQGYKDNAVLVFILGMLITSIIEYFTSYILEEIFHNKWWDYSYRVDNINGRICLTNTIYFGIMALIAIYIVVPVVNNFFNYFSDRLIIDLFIVLFFFFVIDLVASIIIAYNLKERLVVAEELKNEKLKILPNVLENKYHDQISKIRFRTNRLIKVYPNISKDLQNELKIVFNWVMDNKLKKKTIKKENKKKKRTNSKKKLK